MRWENRRRSSNVEDRRGQRSRGMRGIPGGGGLKIGGIGGIVLVLVAMYFGVDPALLTGVASQSGQQQGPAAPRSAEENRLAEFTAVVLADTEETWGQIFQSSGERYPEPRLVLFTDATSTACGTGQSAMGPFYCPADKQVYIDLSFFEDLSRRFGAPGDFAQAYVIAHEVGHHVQTVTGISPKMRQMQRGKSESEKNALSVRLELQADCFAGIWAHHAQRARDLLERGDIDEALTAASAIGDDRLQRQSRGRVVPESFTHGTSEQRQRWFKQGYSSGKFDDCDTFAARRV